MPAIDIHKPNNLANNGIRTNPPRNQSVQEAAWYVGVSQRTFRTWIAERKIRVARIGGRVIVRTVDLDRFIERHLEGPSL